MEGISQKSILIIDVSIRNTYKVTVRDIDKADSVTVVTFTHSAGRTVFLISISSVVVDSNTSNGGSNNNKLVE